MSSETKGGGSVSSETRGGDSGGIGLSGVLGVVFIVLKLTEHIAWSWWWVLSPFWIPFVLFLVFFVFAMLFAAVKR